MSTVKRLPGERNGSAVFYYKGLLYHKDSKSTLKNGWILRCIERDYEGCKATVRLMPNSSTLVNKDHVSQSHKCLTNCTPDPLYLKKRECKSELYKRAGECNEKLIDIFNDVLKPDGA